MKKNLLIIGGGFAGFWAAMSAVRQSKVLIKEHLLEITLINPDNYFTIRPRLYESSLKGLQVKLDQYLSPLGIHQIQGRAEQMNPSEQTVIVSTHHGLRTIAYDYLILATGSALKSVNIPGIERTFNVDNFENAQILEDHIITLAHKNFKQKGASTFIVVGGGFTGLEEATSLHEKVLNIQKKYAKYESNIRIILIEKNEKLASFYAANGQKYIQEVLKSRQIEVMTGVYIKQIGEGFITLSNQQIIESSTVIWAGGMMASPLTSWFEGERDETNRLIVDQYLKLPEYSNVMLAGDVAKAKVDQLGNYSLMACQFAMFQGKWAGHNAVNDLFGETLKPYAHEQYLTCLDLGQEDALFTKGWNREVVMTGAEAKKIKKEINQKWIYPFPTVEENLRYSEPEIPRT